MSLHKTLLSVSVNNCPECGKTAIFRAWEVEHVMHDLEGGIETHKGSEYATVCEFCGYADGEPYSY